MIREAGEFSENLSAVKNASEEAETKLNELRNALTQQTGKTSSSAILLPAGWDKKSILETIAKALEENEQLQELTENFNRYTF